MIQEAIKQLMEDTAATVDGNVIPCITIRERTPHDENYVTFQDTAQGCYTVCENLEYCYVICNINYLILEWIRFTAREQRYT